MTQILPPGAAQRTAASRPCSRTSSSWLTSMRKAWKVLRAGCPPLLRSLAGIAAFRDLCTQAVGDADIRICVENTTGYKPFQLEALSVLLESPVFGLTLDIGHNCCAGFADEQWIFGRADRLRHFHIHDVLNGTKDHLPLGSGDLDMGKYFSRAEALGATAVLEVKTVQGLRQSVAWLKEKL